MDSNYVIDYDLFTTLEIIKIIEFFKLIEQTRTKVIKPEILLSKYREYQNIINNKSLEKKYDKMLFEKSKVSIYQVMKPIINK
ncbi:MAG: hypothetical protein BHW12_00660 [Coprobacillus sp. 28_7]|nr:MAG: hypothetical protein BHW12_00660 [Coprobacillus sp. 28_7]CCY07460.1 putative uncharacterized protein [Coprobacillus sp. CAG:698]